VIEPISNQAAGLLAAFRAAEPRPPLCAVCEDRGWSADATGWRDVCTCIEYTPENRLGNPVVAQIQARDEKITTAYNRGRWVQRVQLDHLRDLKAIKPPVYHLATTGERSAIFFGPPGSGKTTVAATWSTVIARRHGIDSVCWWDEQDLFDDVLTASEYSESTPEIDRVLAHMRRAHCVVINDMGREALWRSLNNANFMAGTGLSRYERIFNVFDERLRAQRPFILLITAERDPRTFLTGGRFRRIADQITRPNVFDFAKLIGGEK